MRAGAASIRTTSCCTTFPLIKASERVRAAGPDVAHYHNITPPDYFVRVHRPRGTASSRRSFRVRRTLRSAMEFVFNRQDSKRWDFLPPRCCRRSDFAHLDRVPNRFVADQFDDEWTNVLFVGRVIANKKIEDLIRMFHAYHVNFNSRSRLLIVGMFSLFERYLASLTELTAELNLSNVHFTASSVLRAGGVLRPRGSFGAPASMKVLCSLVSFYSRCRARRRRPAVRTR